MFKWLKDHATQWLRWSEAYTKTDMIYAARGGFWLSIAKAGGITSSLLLAVAMANLIPQEVFGTYKFVLSAAGIIGAFSLTGIGVAIVQSVARGYEGILRAGTSNYLAWSVGMIGMSLALALYYFINDNNTLALSLLIVAMLNPILIGFSFFSQFMAGKKDFRTQSIYDIAAKLTPTLILIGALFSTQNPILIVLVYFAAGTITNLILYWQTLRKFKPNSSLDPRSLPYAKHLSLMGIMGKVAENVDKILVFHFLGAAQLAIYAFAQTPIAQLKLLNDIPAKLALPKLSEGNFLSLKSSLPRKIFLLVGIMTVIVVIYILAAPFLFDLLFPKYLESVLFTQVLALSLIFAPGSMFGEALTAHIRKRELYISQTVLPIVRIALLLILLPLYGIWGAVGAIIATQAVMFTISGYLFWHASSS